MPEELAVISIFSFATGSGASLSPPCALIILRHISIAIPFFNAVAGSTFGLIPTASSISFASKSVNSTTSLGPPPDRTSRVSLISSAFPAVNPNGTSIAVTNARVVTPARFPKSTIVRASNAASFGSLINAPEPVFTSSTNALVPSAIFLLIIDEAISGIACTVPVTSRRA